MFKLATPRAQSDNGSPVSISIRRTSTPDILPHILSPHADISLAIDAHGPGLVCCISFRHAAFSSSFTQLADEAEHLAVKVFTEALHWFVSNRDTDGKVLSDDTVSCQIADIMYLATLADSREGLLSIGYDGLIQNQIDGILPKDRQHYKIDFSGTGYDPNSRCHSRSETTQDLTARQFHLPPQASRIRLLSVDGICESTVTAASHGRAAPLTNFLIDKVQHQIPHRSTHPPSSSDGEPEEGHTEREPDYVTYRLALPLRWTNEGDTRLPLSKTFYAWKTDQWRLVEEHQHLGGF